MKQLLSRDKFNFITEIDCKIYLNRIIYLSTDKQKNKFVFNELFFFLGGGAELSRVNM